jgi:hypothetical protein
MTGHPERLWGLGPGPRDNAGTVATIAPIGLRAPVPEGPRPEGTERVLVLGDSSFFGYGVDDTATMAAFLGERLKDLGAVINGGVPGYSTAQSTLLMEDVGWGLDPTLLIIGSFWSDTNFAPYADKTLLASAGSSALGGLTRSALVRLIAGRLRLGGLVSWTRFDAVPRATQRRVAVGDYALALDRLIAEASRRDVGCVLITPPEAVEVTGSARPPHHWAPYLEAQDKVANHHGIPLVRTTARFRAHYAAAVAASAEDPAVAKDRARGALFLDDLHPTVMGQSMMAEAVFEGLVNNGWPTMRLRGVGRTPFATETLADTVQPDRNHATGLTPLDNLLPEGLSRGQAPSAKPSPKTPAKPKPEVAVHSGSWQVRGEVAAPCKVRLRDAQGRTVASARLTAAGAYALRVSDKLDTVIVAHEGAQCAASGTARRVDGGAVRLSP